MSKNKTGFFRWFRTLPILALFLTGVVCLFFYKTETGFSRSIFYPVHYADMIQESSSRHNVNPYLVCAIIKTESGWDEWARSPVGAVGLMQVMPVSAETLVNAGYVDSGRFPLEDLEVPVNNIEYGCAMLEYLSRELNSTDEVIAAYNAGLANVQEWLLEGDDIAATIRFPETAAYLEKVNEALAGYTTSYPKGILEEEAA